MNDEIKENIDIKHPGYILSVIYDGLTYSSDVFEDQPNLSVKHFIDHDSYLILKSGNKQLVFNEKVLKNSVIQLIDLSIK